MPKVHEEKGCKVYIYTNDHPPPHVHVQVGDGVVIIFLDEEASIRKASNVTDAEVRKARQVVKTNRDKLLAAWLSIHAS